MTKRTDEELLLAIAEEIMGWHPDTGIGKCQVPAYAINSNGTLRIRYTHFTDLVIQDNWNPLVSLSNLGSVLEKLGYDPCRVMRDLGIKIPSRKMTGD